VRTWLVRVTKLTADELRIRGEPIPQEADLRKYMRLALRYVRRGRTMFGVRTLVENETLAVNHFADFIIVRLKS
jgi:hypothetical protein